MTLEHRTDTRLLSSTINALLTALLTLLHRDQKRRIADRLEEWCIALDGRLRAVSANVNKVGAKAVDGFLRALNPYDSDPSIVSARNYIKMGGRPQYPSLHVANGEMQPQIRWKPRRSPAPALPLPKSVPLARIMDLSMFDGG